MRRVDRYVPLALMVGSVLVATAFPSILLHDAFNSRQAYAYTAQIAGFGERWPGSPGHRKAENLIHQVLQKDGARIEADNFTVPYAAWPRHGPQHHRKIQRQPRSKAANLCPRWTLRYPLPTG